MHLPRSRAGQATLLLLVALASRIALFGDPVIHSDEGFYLLVGDRMLHGAWPFVDIFDRKPVGVFLIFAAIRSIGGDGILAYQIAATVCASVTAGLATRLAAQVVPPRPAVAAGLFYLVWLTIFDGAGGQSSVWYSLPVAGAALVALGGIRDGRRLRTRGAAAMVLIGIAMQIKYTALFEGVFFAVALLWSGRKAGRSLPALAIDALLWIALALAPTLLAFAVYAAAGHGADFFFANFVSIFGQRDNDTHATNALKLTEAALLASPLVMLAWGGRKVDPPLTAWTVVALAAILLMGSYEQHYFIAAVLPLSVAAAIGLIRSPGGSIRRHFTLVLLAGAVLATLTTALRVRQRGTRAQIERLARLVGDRPAGCLFAFNSEPILYYLTRSCLPTPYVFRSHLGQTIEARAIGIDQAGEVARLLAARPGVIVVRDTKTSTNPATQALVMRAIAARYRPVGRVRIGRLYQSVYRLRPGA